MLTPEEKAEVLDALSSLPQFIFLDELYRNPYAQKLIKRVESQSRQPTAMARTPQGGLALRSDYSARRSELAVRIATAAVERGQCMTYGQACVEAEKRMGRR